MLDLLLWDMVITLFVTIRFRVTVLQTGLTTVAHNGLTRIQHPSPVTINFFSYGSVP